MRLTAKLIVIVFLAVAALTAATAFYTVHQQFDSFQRGREETARQLKQQISEHLAKARKGHGRSGVEDALVHMHLEYRQTQMRMVQFNVDASHPDAPDAPRNSLQHVLEGKIESVVIRDHIDGDRLHTYLPITTNDDESVGVELSDSLAFLTAQRRATIYSTLLTLGGLAFVCLGVVMIAGLRLVGRPLEELISKTKRISAGDFSQPVAIRGNDELSRLGVALNEMSDRLREQKETIETETASRIAALSQLRHADRLKTVGRLAAGVAHELGTPLNVVAGRAGLIAKGRLSEDEVRQSAETIRAEADRITRIIRQLLDFARRNSLQRHETDLGNVVNRTAELLTTLAESNHVDIQVEPTSAPVCVAIDESQIQQALTNIVMNAVQAITDRGTVNISLGTRTTAPPDQSTPGEDLYAYIEITDNGVGMSSEQLEQVFEPFFTTKEVGEGTGLGLSIAYGIVQEHSGWIDVRSELGRGSCFTIYLHKEPQP